LAALSSTRKEYGTLLLVLELRLFTGGIDGDLGAAVLGAPFGGVIRRHRITFTMTLSGDLVAIHLVLVDQLLLHGIRTPLGEPLVVLAGAGAVGITINVDGTILAVLQILSRTTYFIVELALDIGLVELEVDGVDLL